MPALTPAGAIVERHWQQLASRRRFYTIGGLALLLLALSGSLWFANETNAGKFFDRLPYVFDFFIDLGRATGSIRCAPCSTCRRLTRMAA